MRGQVSRNLRRFVASVSSNNQSWSRDNSNFVNSSNPWANRGGNYSNTYNAGLFNSNNNTGTANTNNGFRAGTHFGKSNSKFPMGTKNSKNAPESKSFHGPTMIKTIRSKSTSRYESLTLPNIPRGPPFYLNKKIPTKPKEIKWAKFTTTQLKISVYTKLKPT
jgi:hypothetical protein